MLLREAVLEDYPSILTLNEALVEFLSPMDKALLGRLHGQAELLQVAEENGVIAAFLLLLREGKDYDSENYRWFSQHYEKFLYVDRIVVGVDFQHSGYGKLLYHLVFDHARCTGVPVVTAEVNLQPPNLPSLNFHKKTGFQEVGTQWVGSLCTGGKKQVALLAGEV